MSHKISQFEIIQQALQAQSLKYITDSDLKKIWISSMHYSAKRGGGSCIKNSDGSFSYNSFVADKLDKSDLDPEIVQKLKASGWKIENNQSLDYVEYKINSLGFRGDNFTDDPSIVFVGCSHTFGIGLAESDIFASKISAHYGLQMNNLGIPGASLEPQCAYLISKNFLTEIKKPRAICCLLPPSGRSTCLSYKSDGHRFFNTQAWRIFQTNPDEEYLRDFVQNFFADENIYLREKQNLFVINSVAESLNIPFFALSMEQMPEVGCEHVARDGFHYCADCHTKIANRFISYMGEFI